MPGLTEDSIEKKHVCVRIPIKVYKQILRKYARPEDRSENDALVRAAQSAVSEMDLTDEDRAFIENERAKNLEHRMRKRREHKEAMSEAKKLRRKGMK